MSETLKEAKPSDEAWSKAKETYTRTGSWSESVRVVCAIDVAPLIAERDALKARVAELEKERNEARADHFITRVERDGAEDHASETADELKEFRARTKAALAAWREAEADGTTMRQRAESAESSLAASRRQMEGLKEDLERIHSAADEGSYRGCPHCLQVMGMIDDALSALDAPQPEARDASSVEEYSDDDMASVGRALMETLRDNAEALEGWAPCNCPSEIVTDLLNRLSDVRAPFLDVLAARDAIIAEAVEIMRTLSPIKDVPIFEDEEPVVLRVGNFGEYVYMPLGTWSIFRAARAFVEKHGG